MYLTWLDRLLRSELELKLEPSAFCTESESVLKYIRNETRRFQTYVTKRISEIRELLEKVQWRLISSEENPADDISHSLRLSWSPKDGSKDQSFLLNQILNGQMRYKILYPLSQMTLRWEKRQPSTVWLYKESTEQVNWVLLKLDSKKL